MTDCLQAVVDAVLAIAKPNEPIDLYMVEIMEMKHKTDSDTQWVPLQGSHGISLKRRWIYWSKNKA